MKILSTLGFTPEQLRIVREAAGGAEMVVRRCRSEGEMVEAAEGGCDVLYGLFVPDELLRRSPQLKWIQLRSTGANHVMGGLLAQRTDILLTSASGVPATPIAEYTIASMLAWAHGLHRMMRAQFEGRWERNRELFDRVDSLRGKTLSVIGYGSIGRETARLARTLGMRVLALKRNPQDRPDRGWSPAGVGDPDGEIPAAWYGPGQRAEILEQSDFVAVTLPLTAATRHFIGHRELAAMRRNGYIVNIGRGELIDQSALIEALQQRQIGGAGLDVFEREPLEPESELWQLDNVILTPHMSWTFPDYDNLCCQLFAENLRRFALHQPLFNLIDRAAGY